VETTRGSGCSPLNTRSRHSAVLSLLTIACFRAATSSAHIELYDAPRDRRVPVVVYEPAAASCSSRCKVLVFGTGYLAAPSDYSFLLQALANAGYLVVAVQHDLPTDDRMPNTGNIVRDRTPYWERGTESIQFVTRELAQQRPTFDWSSLSLVGHSNGGDIASLYASRHPERVRELVTLDNRRVPLPPAALTRILSLRSTDQPPDPGVLPPPAGAAERSACIVNLTATRHDDMNNSGSAESKRTIIDSVLRFLLHRECVLTPSR
jgi:pimeloyl-ACP methyl ester carboxylesterase